MSREIQKYKKLGFGIEVYLPDSDYIIRANILRVGGYDSKTYTFTMELRLKTVPRWDMMDEEVFELGSDNINSDVYDFIMNGYKEGFFNPYMARYEYELKCFENVID